MSDEAIWFFEVSGQRQGPVTGAVLQERFRSGQIAGGNLVWREGLAGWIPFSESELAAAASSPPGLLVKAGPPPVPKSAEFHVPREARLRPGFRPSIRSCYGRAWDVLTGRFWPLVGCYTLMTLILSVAVQFYIPAFFLMYPLLGGLYWYILLHLRGKEVTLELLFEGFRRQFGPLAVMNLIVSGIGMIVFAIVALVMVGVVMGAAAGGSALESSVPEPVLIGGIAAGSLFLFAVLMLPLFLLGQVGNFATLLILDCNLKAGEALSLAWTATKPHIFKIAVFVFLNGMLSFVGMLALYFGMFITGAWATIALVILYEDAFGDDARSAGE